MVVQLSGPSGRPLAAQARGVFGSTPSGCQPFHFPLFSPQNIYFQHEVRWSEQQVVFAIEWALLKFDEWRLGLGLQRQTQRQIAREE